MVAYPEAATPENPAGADVIYRYVRTPAGAARYGVPIGTRIAVQKRPERRFGYGGYSPAPATIHRRGELYGPRPTLDMPSGFIGEHALEGDSSQQSAIDIEELLSTLITEIHALKAQVADLEGKLAATTLITQNLDDAEIPLRIIHPQ